mmetsp:Transcript_68904/g.165387  ORF Transcript_68904/g.165387 Transcript_68904/m.165387 type:complete len:645 (-) Transcript_68904:125-2059(-)
MLRSEPHLLVRSAASSSGVLWPGADLESDRRSVSRPSSSVSVFHRSAGESQRCFDRYCRLAAASISTAAASATLGVRHQRRRRGLSVCFADAVNEEVSGRMLAQETESAAVQLTVARVDECWQQARAVAIEHGSKKSDDTAETSDDEALENGLREIARWCAYLACVQLKHGLHIAMNEGFLRAKGIVSKTPALPVVLKWVFDSDSLQVYKSGLAGPVVGYSLLDVLLGAGARAQTDQRKNFTTKDELKATVSLLRDLQDISAQPTDWELGVHGLWCASKSNPSIERLQVFLPQSIMQMSQEDESAEVTMERILRRIVAESRPYDGEEDDEDAQLAQVESSEPFQWPEDYSLCRFTVTEYSYAAKDLPKMGQRLPHQDNVKSMVAEQARTWDQPPAEIAATACRGGTGSLRGLVLPPAGAYHNLHHQLTALRDDVVAFHGRVEMVQRVVVLASVWDSYVDGCALLERRCAWYGSMNLDLMVLERLRKSGRFSEVTMEQDSTERSIEALLPVLTAYLGPDHDFTLVPIFVGGVPEEQVKDYTELLSTFAADPKNLFLVAGDCVELQKADQDETTQDMLAPSIAGAPHLVDALELFFATLSSVEDGDVELKWFSSPPWVEEEPHDVDDVVDDSSSQGESVEAPVDAI